MRLCQGLPQGLALTDETHALLLVLSDAFRLMSSLSGGSGKAIFGRS